MKDKEPEKLEAQPLTMGQTLRACPGCQYDGGFHLALERGKGPGRTNVLLRLICPSCRVVYDVGLAAFLK
jgi:hypothetical protein